LSFVSRLLSQELSSIPLPPSSSLPPDFLTRILHVTPSHLFLHLPGGKHFHWPELKFKLLENVCCFRMKWRQRHDLIATRDSKIIFLRSQNKTSSSCVMEWRQLIQSNRAFCSLRSISICSYLCVFVFFFVFFLSLIFSFAFVFISLWLVGSDNWKPTLLIKVQPTFYVGLLFL